MPDFIRCRHDIHEGVADIATGAVTSGLPQKRGWTPISEDPPPLSANKDSQMAYAARLGLSTAGTKQDLLERIAAHINDLPATPEPLTEPSGDAGESEQDNG